MNRLRLAALLLSLVAAAANAGEDPPDLQFQSVLVRRGDTLWGIANTYLKDPSKWDQILKYNRLPSSDPTVALPGMTLKVPIQLIKENLRAAHLIYMINRVVFRRKETADWKPAEQNMELYRGDTLRTMESAKAKVKFLNADLLSLDANSLAVIKPVAADYDVELKQGGLFVGHSRVVTPSARITPKTQDTQYSAKVRPDLSTLVEVYTGLAAVEGAGKTVDVKAGMATEVNLGLAPGAPRKIADLPEFEARAADFAGELIQGQARVKIAAGAQLAQGADADSINKAVDVGELRGDVASLSVGVPISGYHVQASRARDFEKIAFDKIFEPDEHVDLKEQNLPSGVYWFRIALIDLLGTEENFSAARLYTVGLGGKTAEQAVDLKNAIVVSKPISDIDVWEDHIRVTGLVRRDNLTVTVNGRAVRLDESGNFFLDVKLKAGENDIAVVVTTPAGDSMSLVRRVTYNQRY